MCKLVDKLEDRKVKFNMKNNQSGFTLIELFIVIPLPIVISWEIGLIILNNYSLNNWLIFLSLPIGLALGMFFFLLYVQTYAHKKKYYVLSVFLHNFYWLSMLSILYILPKYFLMDAKYFIINAIVALPIILLFYFTDYSLKKNKRNK